MIEVGFTGTRKGWTEPQEKRFREWAFWVNQGDPDSLVRFHHGDAIGADALAHAHVRKIRDSKSLFSNYKIIVHPPIKTLYRAWCAGWDEIRPVKDYLARDKDIVNESQFMIATPKEMDEVLRSGTWATVRYARKKDKIIYFFFPDGSLVMEYNIDGRSTKHVVA